jgi:hypothetical protein
MKKWSNYQRAIEENLRIVNKDKLEVPFLLNKSQLDFIERSGEYNVILKARKMGFSSLILAIGLIKFLHGRNERVVSMSFDKEASGKQLERVKRFLSSYEQINGTKIQLKYNTKFEMSFSVPASDGEPGYTNSLRVGTAKSTGFGRGDDITFLHLTEVSLADDIDTLLAGVGEAVVNDAMVTLETTANGFNAFKTFWDEAVAGQRGYQTFFYDPTWEYSKDYLEGRRQRLGKLFDQEYPMTEELAFLTSGDTYFDMQSLRELKELCTENKSKDQYLQKFRDLEYGEFIIIFADTAWGGGDLCAAQFLSKTNIDVPWVFHKKCLASEMTPILHHAAEEIYEITGVQPLVCYERQNGGIAELERIVGLNRNQKYIIWEQASPQGQIKDTGTNKYGWDTSSMTRPVMLSMLKEAVDNKFIRIYHQPTISEMFSFVEKQTVGGRWRAQAENGAHDDLVMSLAGAWQLYQTEEPVESLGGVYSTGDAKSLWL